MKKTFEQALGEIMKNYRLNRDMSQAQAGELLGKSKYVIHRIENAKHRANDDVIKELCKIYNYDYYTTMKNVYTIMEIDFQCRKRHDVMYELGIVTGNHMKYHRCLNGMSVEDVAKALNVPIERIYDFENGELLTTDEECDAYLDLEKELCKLYHVLVDVFEHEVHEEYSFYEV